MLKTELYKIYTKKIIWIACFVFIGLFSWFNLQSSNSVSVKYTLEPVRAELTQAVANEEFHTFVRNKDYNCSVEEMSSFLPASVFEYIEQYKENKRVYRLLNSRLISSIGNYYRRTDEREQYISQLSEEVAVSNNDSESKVKAKLLSDYKKNNVTFELNLESSANNFVDVNHAMVFPCLIMLVILLGLSGIYSDEYTSGTQSALLTSKKGRSGVFLSKLLAASIFIFSTVIFMESVFMIVSAICHHAPKETISVASTFGFYLTTYSGSVFQFCTQQILGTLVACFTMGCIVMAVSVHSKNSLIPFFAAGIYYGGTALYSNMIEFPKYLPSIWSLPGEMSPFMLQTQVELVASGHYVNLFGFIIPTLTVNLLFNIFIALIALLICYKGYVRKQVKN